VKSFNLIGSQPLFELRRHISLPVYGLSGSWEAIDKDYGVLGGEIPRRGTRTARITYAFAFSQSPNHACCDPEIGRQYIGPPKDRYLLGH
jgi:hypothetical protein